MTNNGKSPLMQRIRLVIVQPWFTAIGHPAQSTLSTARILGERSDIVYLIEDPRGQREFEGMVCELEHFSAVRRFRTIGSSLAMKTACASLALARDGKGRSDQVFFLDASLLVLSMVWPILKRRGASSRVVSLLYLRGPEDVVENPLKRYLVRRFLCLPGVRLYLRTEELVASWRSAFKEVPSEQIDTIPSLEIPDPSFSLGSICKEPRPQFGLIGQVRPGKSIEWLVPLFNDSPGLGELHIAGQYFPGHEGDLERILEAHASFRNQFLSESEMVRLAALQDYLVVLYENWDVRMEAATLFVAARAQVPVLVYDEGWCGRIVREYGCGVAVPRNPRPTKKFFASLPRRDSEAYREMLDGVCRFRQAFSGQAVRTRFMSKMGLPETEVK